MSLRDPRLPSDAETRPALRLLERPRRPQGTPPPSPADWRHRLRRWAGLLSAR